MSAAAAPNLVVATLAEYGGLTRAALGDYLQPREPRRHLYDLVADYPSRGGRMLRPSLCIATARAFGAGREDAVRTAVALELLHNAFLVHDDVEDESDERRGRPTLHALHGVPLAVNVGDALTLLGLRALLDNRLRLGPWLTMRILEEAERMARETVEGQAVELGWRRDNATELTETDYLQMVLKKTCWYTTIWPSRVGALIGTRSDRDLDRFLRFGFFLGAAFQIQDDLLNLLGDRARYGKEIDGDVWEGKRTVMPARRAGRRGGAVDPSLHGRARLDRIRAAGGARPRGRRAARVPAPLRRAARHARPALHRRPRHLGAGEGVSMTTEKERMRHAVWSVYYKARGLRRSVLPPSVRPMRAEGALDILLEHKDENRGARRRRALLEAGAGKFHKRERDEVATRVLRLAGDLNIHPRVLDGVGTDGADDAADEVLGDATGRGLDCVAVKTLDVGVHYAPRTHDSTLEVVSRVNRRLDEMVPFVDPRRWKECSDFFDESEPVDPDTLEPIQIADKDLAGRWQLHEIFNLPTATFDNLLNIEFTVDPPRKIEVKYSLYESRLSTFVGLELPGVLERDSGFVRAVPDRRYPHHTQMTTRKTIRFRDLTPDYPAEGGIDQGQWLNYCAPAMLGLWIDDMSQGRLCCRHLHGGVSP